ncbi:MAG: toll/interleukin-1 receptor domain-containing protein [Pyrinomonadaceae bacterium]
MAAQIAPNLKRFISVWSHEISRSIRASEIVFVFWCVHSSDSREVEAEYKYAIEQGRPVVPVILDETPLPDVLSQYQGIDFRVLGTHPTTAELKSTGQIGPVKPTIAASLGYSSSQFYADLYRKSFAGVDDIAAGTAGVLLIIAALIRPFPALIESELIGAINAGVLSGGLWLLLSLVLRLFRMARLRPLVSMSAEVELATHIDNRLLNFTQGTASARELTKERDV